MARTHEDSRPMTCALCLQVIMDPEQCTEKLMSRANSVKKAIKQIMDHTDAGKPGRENFAKS